MGGKGACGLHCTKINNISVKFGKEQVLKNVNIHVHCGELTVIIGRNGAGKSTLLKARRSRAYWKHKLCGYER